MCFFLAESGSRYRVRVPRDQGSGSMDLELNSWSRDKGPRNQEPRFRVQVTRDQGLGSKVHGPRDKI